MAHVSRPLKTEGNRTYVEEVDAGQPDIIDFEVDEDFRVIYDEFNGGIDNTNIADGAAISYDKLDLAGRIKGSDLDPTTTLPPTIFPPGGPTTGIPGTSIQDHTIGPKQLWAAAADHNGAIGTTSPAPFVTDIGNLALAVTVKGFNNQTRNDIFTVNHATTTNTDGTETLLLVADTQTRSGLYVVLAYVNINVFETASASGTFTVRLKEGGGTMAAGAPDGTAVDQQVGNYNFIATSGASYNNGFLIIHTGFAKPAGLLRYQLSVQQHTGLAPFNIFHYNSALFIFEPA